MDVSYELSDTTIEDTTSVEGRGGSHLDIAAVDRLFWTCVEDERVFRVGFVSKHIGWGAIVSGVKVAAGGRAGFGF